VLLQHDGREEQRHRHGSRDGLGDGKAGEIAAKRIECQLAERKRDPIIDVGGVDPHQRLAAAEHVGVGGPLEHVFVQPGPEVFPVIEAPAKEPRNVEGVKEAEAQPRLAVFQKHRAERR